MEDSINYVNNLTKQGTLIGQNEVLMVSVVIAIIAITLLVCSVKHYKKRQLKKTILKETANVDFTNMTHDWEKTKQLYDVLKKECHPDKFGDDLNIEATRIFQSVIQNKYKYQELLSMKQEAIEKLGIVI